MSSRTSIILDEESRRAARELAAREGCSASEAIRRALVRQRNAVFGMTTSGRKQRREVLKRLFGLFEGSDPADEVRRLKQEDDGF